MDAGEEFLNRNLPDSALFEFEKAFQINQSDGKLYFLRASAQLLLQDTLGAAQNYREAAIRNYLPAVNFFNAAQLFRMSRNDKETEECIDSALAIEPSNPDYLLVKLGCLILRNEFDTSLALAEKVLEMEESAEAWYYLGLSQARLKQPDEAAKSFEKVILFDRNYRNAYLELAKIQILQGKTNYAIDNSSMVLLVINPYDAEAFQIRSQAFYLENDIDAAIDDISKSISFNTQNSAYYLQRANYYFADSLLGPAAGDYEMVLQLKDTTAHVLEKLIQVYERTNDNPKAKNYAQILLVYLQNNQADLKDIETAGLKIFELGREKNKPRVEILQPLINSSGELEITEKTEMFLITGLIMDESDIRELKINNRKFLPEQQGGGMYKFSAEFESSGFDYLTITVSDVYENITALSYAIVWTESEKPAIVLSKSLLASDNTIKLESDDNLLYIEGQINDRSTITQILINDTEASFASNELNPRFTATIDIRNHEFIRIKATDTYGNTTEARFAFKREPRSAGLENPMGKTWVVIIENSNYQYFPNLTEAEKSMQELSEAFSKYRISKTLVKKNLSKREMERFFTIDLRDLILANKVNSLLIWFTGHGQTKNDVGYWIPSDGRTNDVYSYYNLHALKASLYSYTSLNHMLIVSEACLPGGGFIETITDNPINITCENSGITGKKSAQVLASAAASPSEKTMLFTDSFTISLQSNTSDCIPISSIAESLSQAISDPGSKKAFFGNISGLENMGGSFLFFKKPSDP